MNILTAPLFSLFSLSFYRRACQTKLAYGFLYLVYLSVLATSFGFLIFTFRALPAIDKFVGWVKAELPPMTLGPEGLSMKADMPFTLTHPEFGLLVTFDTNKTEITLADLDKTWAYVTSTKVFVKQAANEVRVYDLTRGGLGIPTEPLEVDAAAIDGLYQIVKLWVISFGAIFFFIFFIVWKLLAVLFYSTIGLLFNLGRRTRLRYWAIFNLTLYAITPWTIVQFLGLVVAALAQIPFPLLWSILVTGIYLFFAVRMTEEKPSPA